MVSDWLRATDPHRYYIVVADNFDELISRVNELMRYEVCDGEAWHPVGGILYIQALGLNNFYQAMEYR